MFIHFFRRNCHSFSFSISDITSPEMSCPCNNSFSILEGYFISLFRVIDRTFGNNMTDVSFFIKKLISDRDFAHSGKACWCRNKGI